MQWRETAVWSVNRRGIISKLNEVTGQAGPCLDLNFRERVVMGKLKEKLLGAENVECWREVEAAALLGLPDAGALKRTSLEAVAALPVGTAISSEISISSEGAITVLLKQLGIGWDEDVFPPLLSLMAVSRS